MASPFPPSASSPGHGTLSVHLLPQSISALRTLTYQYPLKLLSPSPHPSQKSVLVFLLTYGGGLVSGDSIHLTITVSPSAKLSIATQGFTKIFKATPDASSIPSLNSQSPEDEIIGKGLVTKQKLDVTIHEGAALCLLPDPVQPFSGSIFSQSQIFKVAPGGSLCLLDWVCKGRMARGEDWSFLSYRNRNEVWAMPAPSTSSNASEANTTNNRLLVRDNVILEQNAYGAEASLPQSMHNLAVFGTLILHGPLLTPLANFFIAEFVALPRIGARDFRSDDAIEEADNVELSEREKWRKQRLKQEKAEGILWSSAKVRGCTVVKFGAKTVESGREWLGGMVREEGSVVECFGEDAVMCLR